MKNIFLLSLTALLLSAASIVASTKPNIVLIMADDMGYETLGANGSEFYSTPNIDRLAAEGMRFEHAYSQPVCTPSRVQIMTGRYNPRNYMGFAALHPNEITFGNILKDAGYRTCIGGKWQLDGGFEGPTNFGFDEYCLWQITRRPSRYDNPGFEINGKEVDFPGQYGPDVVSDFLIDFIKRSKDADEPFFVYYPMLLPHFPFHQTPDGTKYDKKTSDLDWQTYYFRDMVAYADKMVGKMEQALQDMGLSENTLLIFTCDNGTSKDITAPFKGRDVVGGKGKLINDGTHVPFIANWPGVIHPGQVSQELLDFSDILPTVADLGGAQVPTDRIIDGRSLIPLFKGEPAVSRDWVYCWYQRDGKRNGSAQVYARNQTYKLYNGGEFYNVPADEMEQSPLNTEMIDAKARETRKQLSAVIKQIDQTSKSFDYDINADASKNKKDSH